MSKKILGLDLGSNSIGWALLEETDGKPSNIINIGSRIFSKAVEEKTPTPKNVKRRDSRLTRRVIQRRARRKQRMLNYLVKLNLLPTELKGHKHPELILNTLGDPYSLRAKALAHELTSYELGRILLHLVQRRGFLSNRKTLLGDMVDDPDVLEILAELEEENDNSSETAREETVFKNDINQLRLEITNKGFRTLGEYLASLDHHDCKRNRSREGGHLRTDRQMYRDELNLIWEKQSQLNSSLTIEIKDQIEDIIFKQRPLKLRSDRIGKCSLEPSKKRASLARLETQKFRYLQDINNLKYFDPWDSKEKFLTIEQKQKLILVFENQASVSFARIRKVLGFDKKHEFNLEKGNKKLKGNITSCEMRSILTGWDELSPDKQSMLLEDLITIQKKSILKKRLQEFWGYDARISVDLCLIEFEPGHSSHSIKAIRKLLPYLEQGHLYSESKIKAGYGYEVQEKDISEKLGMPPEIANPIVQKGLHELRRLINAIIAEYGKPDAIRIEMARDLEMNTKRYKAFLKQQKDNTKANDEATKKFQGIGKQTPHLKLSKYPSHTDKIKYRLWKDQEQFCAYSGKPIDLSTLFSATIDIDHILPYSQSLDDSYMNKVVCYSEENKYKGQRTPIDCYGGNEEKWNQIVQRINHWDKNFKSKKARFFQTESDLQKRDFISSQLNDTRYLSRVAHSYLEQLGADISVSKGITTSWLRHQWGLNSLIGETDKKERTDHRHHAIDAVVVACIDRSFYQKLIKQAKEFERSHPNLRKEDLYLAPPWEQLRNDLHEKLESVIVSHAVQRKLTGALHEETGVGFIESKGAVYRADLNGDFTVKQVDKVIDEEVQLILKNHLEKYSNNPKEAFAEGNIVLHKDGRTPIKRVRILQSKTTRKKLDDTKFSVRDKTGETFKWLAYGNTHHVEILQNIKTQKYISKFVTTMEAHHRCKGIGMAKQAIIKTVHDSNDKFLMALHINDLVSIIKNGERIFYRVQKLESGSNRMMLRHHLAATLKQKNEELYISINFKNFSDLKLEKQQVNAIGKLLI